ncbi:hypothetical protein CTI14_55130, partial [Methylobacterium radiotolerans]
MAYKDGKLSAEEAAKVKFWATEREWEVLDAGVQLHGGYGYITDREAFGGAHHRLPEQPLHHRRHVRHGRRAVGLHRPARSWRTRTASSRRRRPRRSSSGPPSASGRCST